MRVTTKGQVTIPRQVREALGISPETEVEFIEENGRYFIEKSAAPETRGKFMELRGIATVKMTTDEILSLTRDSK